MTTLLVSMSLDPARRTEVDHHLTFDVPAWGRRQPGFVSGRWYRTTDGTQGFGVVVFDSTESADSAARGPRGYQPDPSRAWNITAVDLLDVVAEA